MADEIRAILFDVYGTLIDIHTVERQPAVWRTLARVLQARGLPAEPARLARAFWAALSAAEDGSGERHPEWDAPVIFADLLAGLGAADPVSAAADVACLFRRLTIRRLAAFPDSLPLLAALRQRYQLALVSDAQRIFLEPELAATGLAPFFSVVVSSSDHGFRKPDRRMFDLALADLGASASASIYIGDNPQRDIGGARRAGLQSWWLNRSGAPPPARAAWRPDYTVASLAEFQARLPG